MSHRIERQIKKRPHADQFQMSRSHLTQPETSLDLGLRSDVNIDKCSLADDSHNGQPWIRSGLARLPPELIHLVCRHLCLCWFCEPRRCPLIYLPYGTGVVKFRYALDRLSKTCRFLCAVAQPYLFHDIERPSTDSRKFRRRNNQITTRLFRTFCSRLPHIANQVRRITLNSILDDLLLLRRLTGLRSLYVPAFSAGGTGLGSYLSFPCLHELHYGPKLTFPNYRIPSKWPKVGIEDTGSDLRAVLTAAPNLSHLSCQRLWHDVSLSPLILVKLPACQITTLELHHCWLSCGTLISFMANFPLLKNFQIWETMDPEETGVETFPMNGPERIADATNGEILPCKHMIGQCMNNLTY